MMAFRIAYFKVNYPVEFYIAYFTVRADLFDAALMTQGVQKVRDEMRKLTLKSGNMTANEKSLYTILEICLEMYERGDHLPGPWISTAPTRGSSRRLTTLSCRP